MRSSCIAAWNLSDGCGGDDAQWAAAKVARVLTLLKYNDGRNWGAADQDLREARFCQSSI